MILKNLSASDFYDEEDLKGLKRLEAVPGIKKFVAETISNCGRNTPRLRCVEMASM